MRSVENMSPLAALCYFAAVIGVAMFVRDLVVAALSLAFSVIFFFSRNGASGLKSHLSLLALFIVLSVLNPFFYRNGATVLFLLGDNPITLEALIYGVCSSATVVSVIYWFRSFSSIMTSDKLLSLFGAVSPKFSLMLSMILRFVPLFTRRVSDVKNAGRVIGMYKEDNIVDTVRAGARVFSGVSGWALENGIVTADSMAARGYGAARRTSFSLYKSRASDYVFIAFTSIITAAVVLGTALGEQFRFYPMIAVPKDIFAIISYAAYALLCAAPSLLEFYEAEKWRYLMSKI